MDDDEYTGEGTTVEDLESRLDDLEAQFEETGGTDRSAVLGPYFFGSCLAMILSWSRNGSILYCIGHGLASWIYVAYFALTRQ